MSGIGIASSLGSLKPLRSRPSGRPDVQESTGPELLNAQPSRRPEPGLAKRSHPDFGKRTIYVRNTTHRDALRKYEDVGGREFSDLVEMLLQEYIGRLDA